MPRRIDHATRATSRGIWVELFDVIDGFAVAVHMVEENSIPVVAEMRIFPVLRPPVRPGSKVFDTFADDRHEFFAEWSPAAKMPSGGLRAKHLSKNLKISDVKKRALEIIENLTEDSPWGRGYLAGLRKMPGFTEVPQGAVDALTSAIESPRSRVIKRDDLWYVKEVAARYERLAIVEGKGTKGDGLYKALAAELYKSVSYTKDLVKEARKRNLLTPAPGRGIAGGRLTPKAKRILERAEK